MAGGEFVAGTFEARENGDPSAVCLTADVHYQRGRVISGLGYARGLGS